MDYESLTDDYEEIDRQQVDYVVMSNDQNVYCYVVIDGEYILVKEHER